MIGTDCLKKVISRMNRRKSIILIGAVLIWLKAAFDWAYFPLDIEEESRLRILRYSALLFPPTFAAFICYVTFRAGSKKSPRETGHQTGVGSKKSAD